MSPSRMSQRTRMHADLMRALGHGLRFKQRHSAPPLQDFKSGFGFDPVFIVVHHRCGA